MSRSKPDDKADPRDSTKTRLKARGPRFAPVLQLEGSRDPYDTHLMCEYVYTGPPTFKKSSESAATTKPPPVNGVFMVDAQVDSTSAAHRAGTRPRCLP
jgi:hypothetical protein